MSSKPLNIALIGYGYAGKTFHAPLINNTPGLNLFLIASRDSAKVHADYHHVLVEEDYRAAIAHPEVDLVVIATPNDTHADLASRALLAGKHVVVDKPFTLTLAEAHALDQLAKQNQRLLSVFHNRRWDADFLTLQQLMQEGTLGEIVTFESRFDRYRPEVRARWREQAGPGSGLWYDLGPHVVDQALVLFGRPRSVSAAFTQQRPDAETVDWFQVRLDYGRLQVLLSASMLIGGGCPRFAVHGTLGSWIKYGLDTQEDQLKAGQQPGDHGWGIDPHAGTLYRPQAGDPYHRLNAVGDYRHYYANIGAAIQGKASNPVTAEQAIAVMEIIELAQTAAFEGRTINLN